MKLYCRARGLSSVSRNSHRSAGDMERFIGTVRDDRLRERLWRAIRRRGAFRRFKDLLARHPQEKDAWFDFKEARLQKRLANTQYPTPITSPTQTNLCKSASLARSRLCNLGAASTSTSGFSANN
jgi:hypothetical protein